MGFVVRNSNKLQNLGLEEKMSQALNEFTLGPMAKATLVLFCPHRKLEACI
jgi:hypothetical protein